MPRRPTLARGSPWLRTNLNSVICPVFIHSDQDGRRASRPRCRQMNCVERFPLVRECCGFVPRRDQPSFTRGGVPTLSTTFVRYELNLVNWEPSRTASLTAAHNLSCVIVGKIGLERPALL